MCLKSSLKAVRIMVLIHKTKRKKIARLSKSDKVLTGLGYLYPFTEIMCVCDHLSVGAHSHTYTNTTKRCDNAVLFLSNLANKLSNL